MASKLVAISRLDLTKLTAPADASITQVEHISSYDWIEAATPTIAVPGCPSRWKPPQRPRKVQKDTGLVYIAQNAARHPKSPLEPLFRAVDMMDPSFDLTVIDLVSDRNNIRKLLSFVDPSSSRNALEAFTITAEAVKNTVILCREDGQVTEYIAPDEFKGYGHNFEKAFTSRQLRDSTGHHRIVSYSLGDLKFLVRHETDGYVDTEGGDDDISRALDALSLSNTDDVTSSTPAGSIMNIRKEGQAVPIESTLEIKTRVSHKTISIAEIAAQLWVSQTPKLVRAYHTRGTFQVPIVENVAADVKAWEQGNQRHLRVLVALLRKIIDVVKAQGQSHIYYDRWTDQICIKQVVCAKMLPDDVYAKWEKDDSVQNKTSPAVSPQESKCAVSTGDKKIDSGESSP